MVEAAKDIGMTLETLQALLSAHVPSAGAVQAVTKFGSGQSNPTYRVLTDTGDFVLRSQPPGDLLPSAHAVDREFRVMRALAGSPVPVPEVCHLERRETSPSGRGFFVMRLVEGRIFWDPALPEEPARGGVYDAMNAALAALHDIDVDAVGLSDFGKPGNYFARQLDRWTRQYRASVTDPLPDMLHLMTWLAGAVPADDGQVALVHGDWRLDNMIFASHSTDIRAVLDWELSTLGHPFADLAYQCMQLRLPHDSKMPGLGGVDCAAIGIPSEAEYLAAYEARRHVVVTDWPYHLTFAFFRLAAILAGVAARAKQGNASNPALAREYGKAVPLLAAMAVAVTREG